MMFSPQRKKLHKNIVSFLLIFSLASGLFYAPISPVNTITEVNAAVAANGNLFYGYTTSAGLLVTRDITASDTYAAAFTETAAGSASGVTFVRAEYAPTRNEALVGSLKVDGRLDVHTCVGDCNAQADLVDQFGKTAVSATSTCDVTAGGCTRPFDLAYEQLSGDAMVVFIDTASDGTIKYCTYNGSAWTPSTCGTPSSYTFNAGSTVDAKWVRLVPYQVGMKAARSDEMMMVVVDTNNDIFAARWDGSNWGNLTTITTTATTSNTQVFDVAWEESTGNAMVVWGEGTTASTQPARYKRWTRSNATWDVSGTSLPVQTGTHLVNWVAMAGAPTDGKNHIAVFLQTATTAGNNCATATNCSAVPYIWDGSNMTKGTQWASTESTLQRGIDVAIESLNTIVNAFFVSSLGSAADDTGYETWIEGTGFAGGNTDNLAGTTGDMGDDADGVVIKSHPGSNDIQILGRNIDDSVQQHRWDGSAGKAAGWQTLVTTTIAPGAVTANANGPEGQAWDVAMRPYSPWSRNWRFYDGTDTAATPTTALAAENTTPTNFDPATGKTRLRFSVQELSAHAQTDGRKKLQFTTDSPDSLSATWTDVDDVGGSAVWRYVDCDGGAATCNDNNTLAGTVLSGSPTAGWSTLDKDAAAGTNMDHSASQLRELEYSIEANSAVGETTYYFRMYDVDQMTPVFREQDNDGSNDCATAVCTYPSITTGKRTILGDGTDGLNVTIYPGHSEQEVGRFSLRTSNGTDTVNAMTVTLGGGANAYQNIATVDVQTTTSSSWTQQTNSGSRGWKSSMASSYDGTKLAGAVAGGYIYTSTDGGVNWTQQTNSGARFWYDITSSADGTRLAAVESGGYIYTSIDGGITWVEQTNSGIRSWTAIASSADGMKLAAAVYGGYIYTSTDGGATWTQQTNSGSRYWTGIASSANGSKLAAPSENQYIYTSTDSGANWTQQNNSGIRIWGDIASSSDGTKLVAVETNGYLYTSTDSGANWTTQTGAGSQQWRDVASSADGSIIVAVPYAEYVYISENSGANWTQQTSAGSRQWEGTASSADGRKLVASVSPGYIYTYAPAASTSKCSLTPSSNTVNLTGCNISVTSTPTEYKIMITPKTHANMPALPGASYDVTATVTSVTATNTVAGTDTDSATVTIDNLSPNNSTSTSGTAGTGAVTLNWTASNSTDISQTVILRWAASTPGAEVPVEGSIYTAGNTITTATVACVLGSTTSQVHSSIVDGTGGTAGCTTSALTDGQSYSYKVFSKDIYGNYDAGVTFTGSPFTPVAPFTISGTSSGLSDGTIVRVAIGGSLDANTTATISSNVWSFNPTGADPTTGQSVVVFATDGDGDIADNLEATAVSVYDGSGEMTGMTLVPSALSIGSANSQSVALSNIDDYTCSNDEDVMHSVSANVLNLQGCSNSYTDETLKILSSNTLTVESTETVTTEKIDNAGFIVPAGNATFNVSGSSGTLFTNSGTFNRAAVENLSFFNDSSLVAYYKLENTNDSKGSNNLTNNGSTPFNVAKHSNGADFGASNSTKYLRVGSNLGIAGNGDITIAGWVKLSTEVNGFFVPFQHASTTNVSRQIEIYYTGPSAPGYKVFAYDGGNQVSYNLQLGTSNWHHLAVTRSGSTTTLYINGVNRGTTSQGSTAYNANTFAIGANEDGTSKMSGIADDVAVFNRALTDSEIAQIYNAGTATSTVNLTGNGDATINSGSPTFYNLTSSGSGTKTLGAGITIASGGTLTVSNGVFDPGTYLVTGSGSNILAVSSGATLDVDASTFAGNYSAGFGTINLNSNSTVTYSLGGTQTVSATPTYGHLTISGGGTKTLGGNTTASGTVTVTGGTLDTDSVNNRSLQSQRIAIESGATLLANASAITLTGTSGTLLSNSGTFTAGTSIVTLSGDGDATVNSSAQVFGTLISSGTGVKTLGGNISIATGEMLSVSGGGTFDPSIYTVTFGGFDNQAYLSLTNSSTLRVAGVTISNSYINNPIESSDGTAIIEYSRSGNQTISADYPWTAFYNRVKTFGSGTKTLGGSISVTGSVDIGPGTTLGLSSYTLTMSGTGASLLSGAGALSGDTGKVAFTGNGAVTVPDYDYYNLELSPTITDNRAYTLNADTVTGNLTINPTAASALALTANMGANLSVTGTTTITRTTSATATLDTDTGTDRDLTTGYLSIQTGGTLDAGGSASVIDLTGTSGTLFTVNGGTFTAGNSSLVISGNGTATINSGTPTFYNLSLTGTGRKSAGAALTITNDLAISNASGILDLKGYNATISGNVTNNGIFDAGTGYVDADVSAFLDATGITDTTISDALDSLVANAKAHGWWTKAVAIYPFVGGTAGAHKYNLKDPRDLDAAFRLTFSDGSHSSLGYHIGAVDADTHFIPNDNFADTSNAHMSAYVSTTPSWFYLRSNTGEGNALRLENTSIYHWDGLGGSGYGRVGTTAISTPGGFLMGSRTSNTASTIYRNGTSLGSESASNASATLSPNTVVIGGNGNTTSFVSIGEGMDQTMAIDMYEDVQAFQAELSRSVDSGVTNFEFSGAGQVDTSNTVIEVGGTTWTNTGTVRAGDSTIKLTNTSATEKTFAGGGATYNNLWLAGGAGGGDYVITGNNTFNDFKSDGSVAHTISFAAGSTQTLTTFTVAGTLGNEVTITSTTTSPFTFVKGGVGDIESDYLAIQYSSVTPYGEWTAGTHSTDMGSNSGWIFNTRRGSRGGGSVGNAGGESAGGGAGNTGGEGTCSDGQQNGNETGVDTGGRCTTGGGGGGAGGEGQGGGGGSTGGEGTCSDGQQNGNETGVDTGGRCTTGGGGGDVGYNTSSKHLAYAAEGGTRGVGFLARLFQKLFWFL